MAWTKSRSGLSDYWNTHKFSASDCLISFDRLWIDLGTDLDLFCRGIFVSSTMRLTLTIVIITFITSIAQQSCISFVDCKTDGIKLTGVFRRTFILFVSPTMFNCLFTEQLRFTFCDKLGRRRNYVSRWPSTIFDAKLCYVS